MQDSVFSPPIALPPFSKRSPIKSGDFSNATVELVKLVRRKLVSVPLWHKLLFLKGVNLDLGILVMRLPTTQIACLGQLNVSVPLRGFWYSGLSDKAVEEVAWFVKFQSPYGDFGTPTPIASSRMVAVSTVSVPLRGFWYADEKPRKISGCFRIVRVSVPLRGFWYADSVSQYPLPDWAHRRFFQTSGFFRLFRGPR